ncbi:MAG TPA: hypothetical protein DCP91_04190 [Eggerthellaceae bacterium]|nr:hypothetical protein [Eggerthellaceae bacterium]
MLEIAVFVIALVAVYAVKAALVVRKHGDLAEKNASFSWMSLTAQDEAEAREAIAADNARESGFVAVGAPRRLHRIGA